MSTHLREGKLRTREQGAALVVGLILLVVVTVLAISGMNTATTELAMARNDQNNENAFQAAETGIEASLALGRWDTAADIPVGPIDIYGNGHEIVNAIISFRGDTPALSGDRAFSLGGGSGIREYHFNSVAQSQSNRVGGGTTTDRDASAQHTQGFYVIGPENSSPF